MKEPELPRFLRRAARDAPVETKRWWRALPERVQIELRQGEGKRVFSPLVLEGEALDKAEILEEDQQLLEFILAHEEIVFFLEEQRFQICRAHAPAKRVLACGQLPANFRCAVRAEECPFAKVSCAAQGRPVRIRLPKRAR